MRRSTIIIIGAALIILAVGALALNSIANARAARPSYSVDDVATVGRGTLIATVSATGSIQPVQSSAIGFMTSGIVADILVKQGDIVQARQALARLDTKALELQLAQAEANLAVAQSKLNQVKKGATASAYAAAQANVASAEAAYNKLLKPDQNELAAAKADLDRAKAALDQAQAAYDRAGGATNPNIGMLPQSLQLQQATDDYQKAQAAFNSKMNPTDAQLKAALAQVQAAQDQLARLTPTGDDIEQAQANMNSAQAARDLARQRVDEATLYAPFEGTIVNMDLDKGAFVQLGKPVVTVADLAHLHIQLNIDETDISSVSVGQKVALDLDAFPGQSIEGQVVEVAPGAATVQGVVNYQVKIQIGSMNLPIKPGMTANANIEVARKENVLLVPNLAVRASNSKRLVTVLEAGQEKEVAIRLGQSNTEMSEVLDGLKEGDQVVTAITPANVPNFGPGGNGTGK